MAVFKLISTGEIMKRTGEPLRTVRRLISTGAIPEPYVVEGSGRFVWKAEDLPQIESAVRAYRESLHKPARELVPA